MKTKQVRYTLGPWRVNGRYIEAESVSESWNKSIPPSVIRWNVASVDGEHAANARLIAAAPDLLEAGTRALAELSVNGHGNVAAAKALRDAIGKATSSDA